MEIIVSQAERAPVTVFKLKGDLTTEEPLRSQAEEAHKAGTRNLLLDLSEVPYMSSAGLRALHSVFDLLREERGESATKEVGKGIAAGTYSSQHLKLLKPSKNVMNVLHLAGFDMFLDIYDDYEKALAAF